MQRNQRSPSENEALPALDLSRLLETIPAAAILVDEQRRIVGANPRFRFARRHETQLVGSRCHVVSHGEVSPCESDGGACPRRECLAGALRNQGVHVHVDGDGEVVEEVWSSVIGGSAEGAWLLLQMFSAVESPTVPPPGRLVGCSPVIVELLMRMARLAEGNAPIVVSGEPGTEREIVARELHEGSPRRDGPFAVLRAVGPGPGGQVCIAPSPVPGREAASPGTIFVDEVTTLSEEQQRVLLAALALDEEAGKRASWPDFGGARWIFGSTGPLGAAVGAGKLLPELAWRLVAADVVVPPLRDRDGDLPALVQALRPWLVAPPELWIHSSVASALEPLPLYGNLWELQRRLQEGALRAGNGPLRAEHLVWDAWPSSPGEAMDDRRE